MPYVVSHVTTRVRSDGTARPSLPARDASTSRARIAPLAIVGGEPPTLAADQQGVRVWTDEDGRQVALGATLGDWHWLEVAGVGSYRFPVQAWAGRLSVEVIPLAEAELEIVIDQFYRSVVPLAWQAYGGETLHASAVSIGGRAVALCAERRTGKSTLAFALQRRGAQALADDAVLLDLCGVLGSEVPGATKLEGEGPPLPTAVSVQPVPFAFRMRQESASHFSTLPRSRVILGADANQAVAAPPARLAAIVLLARHDGAVSLSRVGVSEAFRALLEHAKVFKLDDPQRTRLTMTNYLRLARAVPVYRLAFPAGLDHVAAICSRLEECATAGPEATTAGTDPTSERSGVPLAASLEFKGKGGNE